MEETEEDALQGQIKSCKCSEMTEYLERQSFRSPRGVKEIRSR